MIQRLVVDAHHQHRQAWVLHLELAGQVELRVVGVVLDDARAILLHLVFLAMDGLPEQDLHCNEGGTCTNGDVPSCWWRFVSPRWDPLITLNCTFLGWLSCPLYICLRM
jgi:hypothetical protein